MKPSPAIDRYITSSADFARPILFSLREVIHSACPEVEESIKWSFPNFMYKGKILCHMAAFKNHCSFGFWLGSQMEDPECILESADNKSAMGHLGKITGLRELPSKKILKSYIRQAMRLIDEGKTLSKKPSPVKQSTEVPSKLKLEFRSHKKAAAFFESMPPSHRREYINWINEAKREETRLKRIKQAIELLSQEKSRNWKYEKNPNAI